MVGLADLSNNRWTIPSTINDDVPRSPEKKKIQRMEVSINGCTPKSSILIRFRPLNHPLLGSPIYMLVFKTALTIAISTINHGIQPLIIHSNGISRPWNPLGRPGDSQRQSQTAGGGHLSVRVPRWLL